MKNAYKSATAIVSVVAILGSIVVISQNMPHDLGNSSGNSENISVAQTGAAASLTLIAPVSGTYDAGDIQHVVWTSAHYAPSTVKVALIRKVSDNPARYELVRSISADKANTGTATWVPAPSDVGSGLSIQVGCQISDEACTASAANSALAVIDDGRYSNTAASFEAIEQLNNK